MDSDFGERLKRLRAEMGVSQQRLANAIGMDVSNYRKYENGRIEHPSEETQERIVSGLGLSLAEFRERTAPSGEPGDSQLDSELSRLLFRGMARSVEALSADRSLTPEQAVEVTADTMIDDLGKPDEDVPDRIRGLTASAIATGLREMTRDEKLALWRAVTSLAKSKKSKLDGG